MEEYKFKKGDIIEYCGDEFEVLENYGSSGTVKENYEGGVTIGNFYWDYCGEKCTLVSK